MTGRRNMRRGRTLHGGEAAAWRGNDKEKAVDSNACLKEWNERAVIWKTSTQLHVPRRSRLCTCVRWNSRLVAVLLRKSSLCIACCSVSAGSSLLVHYSDHCVGRAKDGQCWQAHTL